MKDYCFVVFGVAGSVDEGGVAFGYGLSEEIQLWGVIFQFGFVACFEFRPFGGVVGEPFAELVAGGYFF